MNRKRAQEDMKNNFEFYKNNKSDSIWWIDNGGEVKGEHLFSFDKKKIYNVFADYPHNMTAEEIKIFDKENPEWAKFLSERK